MSHTKLALSTDSPAYRLFVEELDKHLLHALSHVSSDQLMVTAQQAHDLGANFHTIRGGAGFFGLKDIAQTAQSLEEHLGDVANGGSLDSHQAGRWILHLSSIAKNLPRG